MSGAALSGETIVGEGTVSYTHLDVYKRQALYDGAYFKALGLAWFSCLVWFAFLIVTGSCVRYIRYGDTPDTADTAAGAA